MSQTFDPFSFDRAGHAVKMVEERLIRSTSALNAANIMYAVIGANAVAAWVGTIDEAAIRFTPNVDILIRRIDFDSAKQTLAARGFYYRQIDGRDVFLDDAAGKSRSAVRIWFANEFVKPNDSSPNPDVDDIKVLGGLRTVAIAPLVRMKLVAFRDVDRAHLRDMIEVDLLDQTWITRLPPELATRLQQLLDTPGG